MFVAHRKQAYSPPQPVIGIALLFYMLMMFVRHRTHAYSPPRPVTGLALLYLYFVFWCISIECFYSSECTITASGQFPYCAEERDIHSLLFNLNSIQDKMSSDAFTEPSDSHKSKIDILNCMHFILGCHTSGRLACSIQTHFQIGTHRCYVMSCVSRSLETIILGRTIWGPHSDYECCHLLGYSAM
jgi:hypothetical protein